MLDCLVNRDGHVLKGYNSTVERRPLYAHVIRILHVQFSGTEPPMESLTDSAKPKKLRRVCIEQVLEDLTILCSSQRYAQVKQAA